MKKRLGNKNCIKIAIILTFIILLTGVIFVGYNILEDKMSHAVDSQISIDDVVEPPLIDENDDIGHIAEIEEDVEEGIEENFEDIEEDIIDDNILESADLEEEININDKFQEGKVAYLTFDDGPSFNITPMILDILEERNINATFFVIGSMAKENPIILNRIYKSGHVLGNHTYSHNYSYIYKNTKNFEDDIIKWENSIKDILGQEFDTNILRFPGGSFNREKKYFNTVRDLGYLSYDWNVINGDGEPKDSTPKMLFQRFKETIIDKKNPIILLHDTDAKLSTVESLEDIIDFLLDEGFVFDTLNYYNER